MYRLLFRDKVIGNTKLEAGDPPMGCVSGILNNIGIEDEFSFFILHCGGIEEDGEYQLELNDDFKVQDIDGRNIPYSGGCLQWYPELNEAVVDLVGIPYPDYEELFPEHVANYEQRF